MRLCSIRVAFLGFAAVALLVPAAGAATTIGTGPRDILGLPFSQFGETSTATYGQTVTVPAGDNVLNRWSFWLDDFESIDPGPIDFGAYVMAWDGAKATGPVLWSSDKFTSTNNHGLGGYEQFTFDTGGLALTSGAQYVLLINASNYFDGLDGRGYMPQGLTPYDGGSFVCLNNGSDFSALTSWDWMVWTGPGYAYDALFEAQFSAGAPVAPVPAPGALLLGSLGAGLVGWLRRRGTV